MLLSAYEDTVYIVHQKDENKSGLIYYGIDDGVENFHHQLRNVKVP